MSRSPRSAVRRLAVARVISITGGSAAYTALMFGIYQQTHSAAWLSVTLLLTFGVTGFVGIFAGTLGDRFDRRKVMIWSDLLGAVFFLCMGLAHAPSLLILFAFFSAVVEVPFWSASAAAIPNLVESESDIPWGNSMVAMARNAGIMLGPVIGGIAIGAFGPQTVFIANAISFGISALLVFTVHGRFAGARSDEEEHSHGVKAGWRFLFHDRVLRTMSIAWVVLVLGLGMGMVADVPLAESFRAGSIGFGLIVTAWGAGSVIGSFVGRYLKERTEPWALVLGTTASAGALLLTGISPWFSPIIALILLFGISDSVTLVAEQGIRQRRTPDPLRSRVMAASEATWQLALPAAYLLAGALLNLVGPQGIYALGGAAAVVAAIVLIPVVRQLRREYSARPPAEAAARGLDGDGIAARSAEEIPAAEA
ncbi:MAG: MFS transporter [Actinomycetota bacterium]